MAPVSLLSNNTNQNSSLSNSSQGTASIAKSKEIREDMSPRDIANVITDKLMSFVDKAFEAKPKSEIK